MYKHNPSPASLELTLKCNNEQGNKLIIPISSLLMQAGCTPFLIGVLWGLAVMTTLLPNIWPTFDAFFSVFTVWRFLLS